MSKTKWYSIFVNFDDGWAKVALIRSRGLATLVTQKLETVYVGYDIEVLPGWQAKVEDIKQQPKERM